MDSLSGYYKQMYGGELGTDKGSKVELSDEELKNLKTNEYGELTYTQERGGELGVFDKEITIPEGIQIETGEDGKVYAKKSKKNAMGFIDDAKQRWSRY